MKFYRIQENIERLLVKLASNRQVPVPTSQRLIAGNGFNQSIAVFLGEERLFYIGDLLGRRVIHLLPRPGVGSDERFGCFKS